MTTKTETAEPAVTLEPRVFDSFREAFLAQQTDLRDIWEVALTTADDGLFILAKTQHQANEAALKHLVVSVSKLTRDDLIRLSREAMAPA